MKITLMILILLFPCHSYAANLEKETIRFLEIFDGYCLQNSDNFANIEKLIANEPNKASLPPGIIAAMNPSLVGSGKGYGFKNDGHIFMVSWNENSSCGVAVGKMNINIIKKIIKANYKVETFNISSEGMQVTETYLFKQNSSYNGGALLLVYAKNKVTFKGAALNYIPEREMKKLLSN